MVILEYIVWAIVFVLTAGLIGRDRFKNSPVLMSVVAVIATLGTISTFYFAKDFLRPIVVAIMCEADGRFCPVVGKAPPVAKLPQSISDPFSLKPGDQFRNCFECPEMVVVPAGTFVMGSPRDEIDRDEDEGPQRPITVSRSFAIGKFEVTFAEWDTCVAGGGCNRYQPPDQGWGRGQRPVIFVNLEDARSYVRWLSKVSKKRYRLLTEAEWEYAARGGTSSAFPWGNLPTHENANYAGGGGKDRWDRETAPVGSFSENPFRLHDTHGNVWEWTEDCVDISYEGRPPDSSAWTKGDCSQHEVRGGSWQSAPKDLRSANRSGVLTSIRNTYGGFRVARDL